MLDRVREALFSTLQPWLEGACVLDLFAGSGALGIEALSRGARHVRFVESGVKANQCLEANVREMAIGDAVQIVRGDALHAETWGQRPIDIAFFDSPYPMLGHRRTRELAFRAMKWLVETQLAPEGVLVFHAPHRVVQPQEFPAEHVVRERVYGTNSIWYVQRDEAEPDSEPASPEGSEPAQSEPGQSEPSRSDPGQADPEKADPEKADPEKADPAQ